MSLQIKIVYDQAGLADVLHSVADHIIGQASDKRSHLAVA
jgi:hypothetical protein